MTVESESTPLSNPEGLTQEQETLIDMLFKTKIRAEVGKIRMASNGKPEYYKTLRPTTPIDFAQSGDEFALVSHREQIKRGETLSLLSPIYLNFRELPREIYDQMGSVLSQVELPEKPDFCLGIPKAGIPITEAFHKHSEILFGTDFLEKIQTSEGEKIAIKGLMSGRGEKVLLIDDLATKADTKLEAIKALENAGFKVIGVLVVVDREQGAREQLSSNGHKLLAAMTITQILQYGLRTGGGGIDQKRYTEVMQYLGFQ